MKKLNQKGFEVLGLLVIIVVVIVVAGTGFYLFKQRQNKQTAQTVANSAEVTNGNTGTAIEGYLDIPELGIQLKLADGVKDATYALMGDGSTFGVSTQALEQQYGANCGPTSGNVAMIAVFVSSNGPNFGTGATDVSAYPDAFKSADGTYYALNYSPIKQQFCGSSNGDQQAADALQKQVVDGFSKTKVQQLQ